jgi:hypothetical protein
MADEPMRRCALCGKDVPPGEGYVVRIDVFADPELPPMTGQQIEALDFDATFAELMEQIKQMSAEELQEGVHRRIEYRLCPPCHRRYLANPLGVPRDVRVGTN